MTAQLLPSVVASPFSSHLHSSPNIFSDPDSTIAGCAKGSPDPFAPFFVGRNRQISSTSFFTAVSSPVLGNDENQDPLGIDGVLSTSACPVSSGPKPESTQRQTSGSEPLPQYAPTDRIRELAYPQKRSQKHGRGSQPLVELYNEEIPTACLQKHALPDVHSRSAHDVPVSSRVARKPARVPGSSDSPSSHDEHSVFGSFDQTCSPAHDQHDICASKQPKDEAKSTGPFFTCHTKRLSTASSAFVHTIKTASLSNASFSIVPRSSRFARSTDSYGIFGSHARQSIESDRPGTSASVDEAAFRRGLRRRQILGELLATEEGYIADLKALIYLYSTLLASTTSLSNPVRSAILRNVHDLLHMHEKLMERLHQASYEAAVRQWADTSSPRDLGSPHGHKRWRSMESAVVVKLTRSHRHTRSSIDSSEAGRGRAYLGCAEPRDVSDMAAIFKDFSKDFFVYEEYCANHSLIAHELQRHAPTLWTTYESGIESLSRTLIALDQKHQHDKKGLTVGDLLIKPIQRVTKYPLLFDDLLRQTPVADCPSAHTEVAETLKSLRGLVQSVNQATNNHETRAQVQRRWSLQARLMYNKVSMKSEQLRLLGNIRLCGVLHVTWQTKSKIDSCYALCVLFENTLLIAVPAGVSPCFEVIALLHLSDLSVGSPSDGRGLQCHSALHTWKICFEASGHLHEFILSACSAVEERTWKDSMLNKTPLNRNASELLTELPSCIGLDLRSIGMLYGPQASALSRHPSVQRAATVGNRANICQVIIRNTHNPQDLHDFRQPSSSTVNRSQSHMTSNRIVVLAPKRSERARLESNLGDVWTKDKLPHPGMIGFRGGQIIRASAGTLVRKLSLVSIHGPFSRRSGSLSLSSRKSYEAFTESRRGRSKPSAPIFEVRKDSFDDTAHTKKKSQDLPELDTMENVVGRMIGNGTKRLSFSHGDTNVLSKKNSKGKRTGQELVAKVGPEDPAEVFYSEEKEKPRKQEDVEEGLVGSKKKRWSNPPGILKGFSAEGLRNMLYSTK